MLQILCPFAPRTRCAENRMVRRNTSSREARNLGQRLGVDEAELTLEWTLLELDLDVGPSPDVRGGFCWRPHSFHYPWSMMMPMMLSAVGPLKRRLPMQTFLRGCRQLTTKWVAVVNPLFRCEPQRRLDSDNPGYGPRSNFAPRLEHHAFDQEYRKVWSRRLCRPMQSR